MTSQSQGPSTGWETTTWTCPTCDWTGRGKTCNFEWFTDLFEVHCPGCDAKLFIVSTSPSVEETREAAEAGNQKAVRHLELLRGLGRA